MENFPTKSQIHANTLNLFLNSLRVIAFLLLCLLISNNIYSQNTSKAEKEFKKALEYLNKRQDDKAIEYLDKALSYDKNYPDALLCMGEIYYNKSKEFDSIKKKAFPYYQRLVEVNPDYDLISHYRLGEFYLLDYNTQKAKYHLEYLLSKLKAPKDQKKIDEVKRKLQQAEFINYSLKNPVPFIPMNMGENINTKNDEYLPTLTADEQTLVFTSLIPEIENDRLFGVTEVYKEDFYITNKVDGKWEKAKKMPPPFNSSANEGALSISPDGRMAYFTRCNTEDCYGSCDLFSSEKIGDAWSEPKNMGENVNSTAWDSQPTIASDGRTLFFVSNRAGGKGGDDIWYTYKKDDGTWTKAKNVGSTINTEGDEMYPFIHPSNTTLYFSSNYHIGMGGFDIFYSNIVDGKFTEPKNIGYPVNTYADETSFIVSPSGQEAIFSTFLEGGYGKKDLYEFELYKEAQPNKVVYMKGHSYDKITNNPLSVKFEVKDINKNRLIASSFSDPKTGEYLVVLPLGADYALNAWADGYLFYSENFKLNDENKSESSQKDIFLTPIIEGESVVLNNIFFQSNSAELLESSQTELNTLIELLDKNKNIIIEISGHTDNTGSQKLNLELSDKRANSVKAYLVSKGIDESRLEAKGYGQTKPIAENSTEEGKAKNRRTEFKIIKK